MRNRSRTFKITIAFVVLIAAWIAFAPFLAENLIVEKTLPRADAMVILAGSGVYVERTDRAAELYKQGAVEKIVLTDDGERTGWSRAERRNIPYVEMAQRNLIAQGIPAEALETVAPRGSGTIYEAQSVRETARARGWRSILIVTSAYHTRRARAAFETTFADDRTIQIGIAAAPPGRQTPPAAVWWLTVNGWTWIAGEYVKSAYYWAYY